MKIVNIHSKQFIYCTGLTSKNCKNAYNALHIQHKKSRNFDIMLTIVISNSIK